MKFGFLMLLAAALPGTQIAIEAQTVVPLTNPPPILRAPPTRENLTTPPQSLDSFLRWDSASKDVTVTNGTPEAHFVFSLTNISPAEVTINGAYGSCGCTVAKLPAQPWKLLPGTDGQIKVTMNLAGKSGVVPKTVTVSSDKGTKVLYVKTTILPPMALPAAMAGTDRQQNQRIAIADRQAVFRGDCARCHTATKDQAGHDKMGQALYQSVCGVCHEAEHRASMVPNLHAIPQETNAEFWRNWITHGKPGSLMPAFAQAEGGILTDAQITSLVDYLTATIPSKPTAAVKAKVSPKVN